MSNQLKRLLFFIVVISGALCTVEDYVIMSQCAHNKAIHLAAEGTVSVTDISQIQNITIVGLTDYVNNEFKIALFAKETQRYLCFNDNWRLVGMKELRDTCYFNETIVHGYFVFRSVVDLQRRIGFTHRGKPVGPKKSVNDACYMFNKIDAEQFFHQHTLPKWRETAATMANGSSGNHSGNYRKVSRNKNNRHKSNNQNQKLQQQQHAHHGHNSSNSLSSTNKTQQQQLALVSKQQQQQMQQQQREQHQVRHHHNDPSVLARRKQRRKQQQQQQQQQQRVTASPTKLTTAKSAKSTTSAAATATAATAKTTKISLASKRKGRRRKARKQKQQQQQQLQQQELQQLQLLSTAATLDSSIEDMLSSSSSSSFSTGFDDAYSSSSSSEPWTTWYATPTATIDSFTPDVGSSSTTSNMLLTTTAEDSIKPYSRSYDDGSTFITELENEASGATTVSVATSSSGNDTDLLQYEAEVVEDDEIEQHTTANYETKATATTTATSAGTTTATTIPTTSSQVAKTTSTTTTAATTTTTTTAATSAVTGTQLVLEQTPLAATLATLMYNKWHTTQQHEVDAVPANTTATAASAVTTATTTTTSGATAAATRSGLAMSTHKLSRHRGIGSSASPSEQQQQLLRDSSGKQQQQLQLHKLLRPATIVTTSSTQLLTPLATAAAAAPKTVTAAAAAAAATVVAVATPQQHITDKLFSVYKNINSNPNNTLTETAPTPIATARARARATATIATTATTITTKKSLRKSTQKLLATPYHQLTYVRNEAGDIDIDNLDNISVYPDVFEDILNDNDDSSSNSTATNSNSNSRLTFVSGFLATSPTSVLPESIRIAKIKINNERRRLQQRSQRRLRSFS
ncbi:cell wall protein DAN4 isoform X2 [Drosophila mojavensis]|uniref:cell wall protein DAN4 isoform X2 n=1 Tax=Drosophila mojavensis TaxID=7230 RepID=UPI00017C9A91|nr:cell wall protein DAN4 isoform X2 [Drosophila mojavensis]